MPHGHPDYGVGSPLSTIYAIEDMAELAARLGSISTFDRRGNVIFMDGFESGLAQWALGGSGTNNAVTQCSEFARNGAFCAKLRGGSSLGLYASMVKKLPYPVIGKLGLEASFDGNTDFNYFEVRFQLYDGTTLHTAKLRFTYSTGAMAYYDSNADMIDLVTGLYLASSGELFSTVKLVVDFENEAYERVLFNSDTYDVSGIAYFEEASAADPQIRITLIVINETGNPGLIYVDDVILTQNEP